jgi:hypothetical protein
VKFREFNFLPTGQPYGRYAALERPLLFSLLFNWPMARRQAWARQLLNVDRRKQRVHRRLDLRVARFHLHRAAKALIGGESAMGLVFPTWYES